MLNLWTHHPLKYLPLNSHHFQLYILEDFPFIFKLLRVLFLRCFTSRSLFFILYKFLFFFFFGSQCSIFPL